MSHLDGIIVRAQDRLREEMARRDGEYAPETRTVLGSNATETCKRHNHAGCKGGKRKHGVIYKCTCSCHKAAKSQEVR